MQTFFIIEQVAWWLLIIVEQVQTWWFLAIEVQDCKHGGH
jgi:hypothetical protein